MLLVAKSANTKNANNLKNLAHWYSSKSPQGDLSNEYHHDRV